MAHAPKPHRVSAEEYLALEAVAKEKSEYRDGVIYGMAGGSLAHAELIHALGGMLYRILGGSPCRAFGSEIKVRVERADSYYYPDATIVCGEVDVESPTAGIIRNPTVVFEVLSPGTEGADTTFKLIDYQSLPSVQEVVHLPSGGRAAVVYRRGETGWTVDTYLGKVKVPLNSVGVELDLDELYARVVEAAPPGGSAPDVAYG